MQRAKTSENFAEEKFAEDISEKMFLKIEDITLTGCYSISGDFRSLRRRLSSSEKV